MNISQDWLKMSCFHDYTRLMDLFLGIQMGLQVCSSAERGDNENNNRCGVGSDESPLNCADSTKALCAGGVQTQGTTAQGILVCLLLVYQDFYVVSPPGWSWREEEWEGRREKVEGERGEAGREKANGQCKKGMIKGKNSHCMKFSAVG